MARVLYDGLVEYEDGTPATTSQMAKDVVEFLNWAAEPEMDQRKKMGVATVLVTSVLLALSIWVKRYVLYYSNNEVVADSPFQVQVGTCQDTKACIQPSSCDKLSGTRTRVIDVILLAFHLLQTDRREDCTLGGRVYMHHWAQLLASPTSSLSPSSVLLSFQTGNGYGLLIASWPSQATNLCPQTKLKCASAQT